MIYTHTGAPSSLPGPDPLLVAEIVKHFYPRLVDLHSYVPACSTDQKLSNWSLLNRKVFHKLHLSLSEADIHKVVANTPGAIEPILCALRVKVEASTVHVGSPGIAVRGWDPAVGPWEHLARVQQQLEDKEQALSILQETVKLLQMKVVKLEYLVQLKDLRIGELMRPGPEEYQDRGTACPKSSRP
ncbi:PREDICTED: sperm flagellar protein 1-like [Dipodomys ordii]|uniref:Sperm flagellar protein 1-like n=1 Tax=Dipodomys ordii TaxID=10020 RepID=A0A1S3GQI2_DIPOR|nr:PREDICTED: sperm flagellar protein 1-like [Dipodomys ordii]